MRYERIPEGSEQVVSLDTGRLASLMSRLDDILHRIDSQLDLVGSPETYCASILPMKRKSKASEEATRLLRVIDRMIGN